MSIAFFTRPKRHKILPKQKRKGEGRKRREKKTSLPNVFIPSIFVNEKKPKRVKKVKIGPITVDIFLKIQLDIIIILLLSHFEIEFQSLKKLHKTSPHLTRLQPAFWSRGMKYGILNAKAPFRFTKWITHQQETTIKPAKSLKHPQDICW